jgi:hypothetical protein
VRRQYAKQTLHHDALVCAQHAEAERMRQTINREVEAFRMSQQVRRQAAGLCWRHCCAAGSRAVVNALLRAAGSRAVVNAVARGRQQGCSECTAARQAAGLC